MTPRPTTWRTPLVQIVIAREPGELLLAAVAHASITPALAETVTCSVWNGVRTCSSPGGYTSTETQWQGLVTGQDGDGNRDDLAVA